MSSLPVSSVAHLTTALASASPGDRITVAAGTYAGGTIAITRSGSAAAPIVISAAGVGAAQFTGDVKIEFGAVPHVVLEGFSFTGSAGLSVPPTASAVRITCNTFDNVNGNSCRATSDVPCNRPTVIPTVIHPHRHRRSCARAM